MSVTKVNVYKIADFYVAIHCQNDDELWDNIPQYEPFELNPYVNQRELAKALSSDKFIFNINPVKAAENSAPKNSFRKIQSNHHCTRWLEHGRLQACK